MVKTRAVLLFQIERVAECKDALGDRDNSGNLTTEL